MTPEDIATKHSTNLLQIENVRTMLRNFADTVDAINAMQAKTAATEIELANARAELKTVKDELWKAEQGLSPAQRKAIADLEDQAFRKREEEKDLVQRIAKRQAEHDLIAPKVKLAQARHDAVEEAIAKMRAQANAAMDRNFKPAPDISWLLNRKSGAA
jgi:hypothetical protein